MQCTSTDNGVTQMSAAPEASRTLECAQPSDKGCGTLRAARPRPLVPAKCGGESQAEPSRGAPGMQVPQGVGGRAKQTSANAHEMALGAARAAQARAPLASAKAIA